MEEDGETVTQTQCVFSRDVRGKQRGQLYVGLQLTTDFIIVFLFFKEEINK